MQILFSGLEKQFHIYFLLLWLREGLNLVNCAPKVMELMPKSQPHTQIRILFRLDFQEK